LIFGLTQNGQMHIFRKSLTGSGAPEVMLQTAGMIEAPRSICTDGHYLAYARAGNGNKGKFLVTKKKTDVKTAQRSMQHAKSATMLDHYAQTDMDELIAAKELMLDAIFSHAKGPVR
jgi:hypothetical protein